MRRSDRRGVSGQPARDVRRDYPLGGSAGLEIGMRMKRGLIVVGGPVRDFAGLEMKGGTIVLPAARSYGRAPG